MRTITLMSTHNTPLYEGQHRDLKEAIEYAISQNIPLNEIDLSYKKLRHINLDGVHIKSASFKGADLRGANMSEAQFISCDFSESLLDDVCFCYSDILYCNFRLSHFHTTDISMATLDFCEFEGLSLFDIDFHTAYRLRHLTFTSRNKTHHFSSLPALVTQGKNHLVILDNTFIFNDYTHTFEEDTLPESTTKTHTNNTQSTVD